MKNRQCGNRPDRRTNKALRRKYERLALTRLIERLEAPDTDLQDELKMLGVYCEFKKHDISERRVGRSDDKSSGAGGARTADSASRSPNHPTAHLAEAVRELYGVAVSGATPSTAEPIADSPDEAGGAEADSTEPNSRVA
ncbi:MAG: hypothetical protein KF841_14490 [Phycisphaerae bacterium]|nr:hypothetical protein [Phycisphaerae bacterium]